MWNWCSNTCEYLAEMYKWLYSKTIELGTVMFLFWNFPEVLCNFFVSNNCFCWHQFSSVHFSRSVVPDSLWPHGLQHTKPSCPSQTARVYSNSSPLSRWCHPNILSSVVPFSSSLQSFPASGTFPMSQFFASSGQSIGALASTSVVCRHRTPNHGSLPCSIDLLIFIQAPI